MDCIGPPLLVFTGIRMAFLRYGWMEGVIAEDYWLDWRWDDMRGEERRCFSHWNHVYLDLMAADYGWQIEREKFRFL
ncbi:hypothetical protein EYC80_008164 [Monilinia laxa]|uniref:Uncharacterized protein n=1 Tax=Monilinia laxa TaxID=61186 RepID=A0A5N6JTP4_MONLA|nr:hypothetical protein EYC80_008164 [Monilinia laxa]